MNSDVIDILNFLSLLRRENLLEPKLEKQIVKEIQGAVLTKNWCEVRRTFESFPVPEDSDKLNIFTRYRRYIFDSIGRLEQRR